MTAEKLRQQILSQLADLQTLCASSAGARATVMLDQSRVGRLSRMDALQGQAMAQETARRRDNEVARINAALKRIEQDEYGYCLGCGEKIAVKRLTLDPTAAVCVTCASAA